MPHPRLLLNPLLWLLLAASAAAQNRPATAPRQAAPAPAPNCLVSEFRSLALGTHDVAERGKLAAQWLQRNASACSEDQLRILGANRTSWLGTADSTQLMGAIDGALETRLKNRPELLTQMFTSAPPRVAANETMRSGAMAPRPAPVVAPGTPAAVTGAAPPVVVQMPGAAPGALPPGAPGAVPRPVPGAGPMPVPGAPPNAPLPKAPEVGRHFDDRLRSAVREHFTANRGNGPCPPGVILKAGRCESPLSERAWKLGQPLPGSLTPKDLPPQLQQAMGPAPAGHSYVQVDADLLLINTATRTVVDAVMDLGQVAPKA